MNHSFKDAPALDEDNGIPMKNFSLELHERLSHPGRLVKKLNYLLLAPFIRAAAVSVSAAEKLLQETSPIPAPGDSLPKRERSAAA